jgi:transposase
MRRYRVIAGDLEALAKVVRALRARDRVLHFVYEARPCGFGIHRYLTTQGEECVVVNPSSMPKRSGDRIKTDRRDGEALARLHRAGELTAIYIPTADDEALRDLVRTRDLGNAIAVDVVGCCVDRLVDLLHRLPPRGQPPDARQQRADDRRHGRHTSSRDRPAAHHAQRERNRPRQHAAQSRDIS